MNVDPKQLYENSTPNTQIPKDSSQSRNANENAKGRPPSGGSLQSCVGYYGQENIAKVLDQNEDDTEVNNIYHPNYLYLAALKGGQGHVQLPTSHCSGSAAVHKSGKTPLDLATEHDERAVVKLLLQNGAQVNARDAVGLTALHVAPKDGYEAVMRVILEYDVEIDAKDLFGFTALHHACKSGKAGIVRLLLEKGADIDAKRDHG